jgi:small-conductance mechanosensitive channel
MPTPQRFLSFFAAAALAVQLPTVLPGQPVMLGPAAPSAPAADPTPAPQPAVDKFEQNAEKLRIALRKLETVGPADSAAAQQVAHFQSVGAVLAQQKAVEQQIKDLEERKAELESQLKSPAEIDESISCSFLELDSLKDELAAEEARANFVEDKLSAAKVAVEKSQRAVEECDVKRRQALEQMETGKNGPNAPILAAAVDQARQASELASETLMLRQREVAREQLSQEVQKLAVQVSEAKVARLSPLVDFSEWDYQQQIDDIKKKEESANKTLVRTQDKLQRANYELQEAQRQYDAASGDRSILAEELKAKQQAREQLSIEIGSQTQKLQRYAQLRVAWNRRFLIASADEDSPDREAWSKLKEWRKETKDILAELAADLRWQIVQMRERRSALTSTTKKAEAAANGADPLRNSLYAQQLQLESMLRTHEKNLVTIETSRRVHEKLLEEIGVGVQALTPKNLALGALHQAETIWNFPIASVGENQIITVRKVVTALALFISGWILSRMFSAVLAYRLLKQFRLSKDGSAAIRTLVFYILLAIVVPVALRTANVPLTAFTILGGALAIGVGFGSQALINNFIGGLIMLAERPVRLGERITFGKVDGTVEDVGFRCTKLRTQDDHLVTIPNSSLVNESIENIDRRRTIRRVMNVAVTYNTTRQSLAAAVQAIRDILEEKEIRDRIHPIVGFEEFTPRVFFTDYNTESLNIQIVYWYAPADTWAYMEHCERVNYRIMEEFERLGVEFAFPSKTAYVNRAKPQSKGSFAA